ncbi:MULTISPECIES: SDR family oxidoreductase [unclassified Ruegeria]|uniref:SDR family oxidoreductase n=1 Tax=unclassified Ruegeria TaxID=2625375 RepID=UPI0014930F64|nr:MULTISPECIES: SDR family oxidoreductase [unclassified Ruegeria]NOD46252.1 SDR family oxidoreductase [Ruegeria sp. HKCCD5849]NOD50448.1 SDR family oxidoreductase [Ruegeria sp. HKCCD5851]NOD67264.1 SDR family oxidoreductase [Ruegeria sp. HKCCD7303]
MTPDTLFSLEGKTALVTGGATGIGRMAAEALVRAGARVLIASRKGDACAEVAAELNALDAPGSAEGFSGDIGSEEGIASLVSDIQDRTERLDILMNNSGVSWGAPLGQFPYDAWGKVMSVNVTGIFELTQRLLPILMKSGTADDPARIVNVGSVMGEVPMGDGAYSYSASKSAVLHLTKIMAKELSPYHITVNALAPGPFVSRMTAFATADEGTREKVGKSVPLGRVGRDEDIAGCMLFLCGRGGSYVTGAVIPVSGGINVVTAGNIFAEAL